MRGGAVHPHLPRRYLRRERLQPGEFYGLVLFATAGMMFMAGALGPDRHLPRPRGHVHPDLRADRHQPARPAVGRGRAKYFLLGAFSSAFFLYGIALVYGATGSTN